MAYGFRVDCMNWLYTDMPAYSLLFALDFQSAQDSALVDWKWEPSNPLYTEFRRPDNGELVRYLQDSGYGGNTLRGLRWNSRVYLGRGWQKRRDAIHVQELIDLEFFKVMDPELPPPRPRKTRDDRLAQIERQLRELK